MDEDQSENATGQEEEFVYTPPSSDPQGKAKMPKPLFYVLAVLAVMVTVFLIKDNLSASVDLPRLMILALLILFEVLILKFIYNYNYVLYKITIKKDGLYLRGMHTATWDDVESFYINDSVVFIVFKQNAVTRYTDSIDLALNFGAKCESAANILRKYIPEIFKESPESRPLL